MEDNDYSEPIDHYHYESSSMEEEQLRVIYEDARKLASERDTSQVRFVTCMGYDEDLTTRAQLMQVFAVYGRVRGLRLFRRSAEIEYEEAASAHQAVVARIDFFGRRLVVIYTEQHVMACPVRVPPTPPVA